MSAITGVISLSQVALNPIVTASLLWVLTKSPPQLRGRLIERFAALRDPRRLARILNALKALLALGLLGTVNQQEASKREEEMAVQSRDCRDYRWMQRYWRDDCQGACEEGRHRRDPGYPAATGVIGRLYAIITPMILLKADNR
jgi:hypothetical protein